MKADRTFTPSEALIAAVVAELGTHDSDNPKPLPKGLEDLLAGRAQCVITPADLRRDQK